MAYESITIKDTMTSIMYSKMLLPAIQRKYIWDEERIIRLMDSIMRGYPIGTCLYWKVKGEIINKRNYSMYEFIRNFHQRDNYENPPAPSKLEKDQDFFVVLDGQQRLTSLYITLQGTLQMKLPRKRWDNDDAFPKNELYMNLKKAPIETEDDVCYEFAFMSEQEAKFEDENKLWYKVKDIVDYDRDTVFELVFSNNWGENPIIRNNLVVLNNRLVHDEVINYFEVDADTIDKVLDIFVRINSGGVVLSKTDLLFSTVVSHWDKARDEIEDLLKSINKIGQGFRFSNDHIMRACLYSMDFPINLQVESFTKDNVLKIQENWSNIKIAIKTVVNYLDEFGFCYENITSYIAILPMIYYIYHHSNPCSGIDKENLRKYFIFAQLKKVFGAGSNGVLSQIREKLKSFIDLFDLESLSLLVFSNHSSLKFDEADIDELFEIEKGAYTFMVLSLLYPNLKFNQTAFHQDHMHPYSAFTHEALHNLKFDDCKIKSWQQKRNFLANLQLLEGRENESKNASSLIEWLNDDSNKKNAKYLPSEDVTTYELKDFEKFMEERKKLMTAVLKEKLL